MSGTYKLKDATSRNSNDSTWVNLSRKIFRSSSKYHRFALATRRLRSINLEGLRGLYASEGNASMDLKMTKAVENDVMEMKKHGVIVNEDNRPANHREICEYLARPRHGEADIRERDTLVDRLRTEGITVEETTRAIANFLEPRCEGGFGEGEIKFVWDPAARRSTSRKTGADYYEYVNNERFCSANIPTELHGVVFAAPGRPLPNFFLRVNSEQSRPDARRLEARRLAVIGARGMHKLENHIERRDQGICEDNACVISATFDNEYLKVYTARPYLAEQPASSPCPYTVCIINTYPLYTAENMREALNVLLNAQDWCHVQRENLVRRATDMASGNA